MELLENIFLKLNVASEEIRSVDLQEVMLIVKKTNNLTENFEENYSKILTKLWDHLILELPEFDDQLLCATCFYTILNNLKSQEMYFNKALQIVNHEIKSKREQCDEKSNTSVAVSLCYGIFQSSYLLQQRDKPHQVLDSLLKATFDLMMLMANDYSQHTFIVFKTMTAFKKVIETPFQDILFNTEKKIKLLNLINHNWESPITGVRNLNRMLFQMLLLVFDSDMYEKVFYEINGFYWNKAKFLMLTEIIEHNNGNIEELVMKNQWVHGLTHSLNNPGLVSAGADMYYSILKKLHSESSWITLFLGEVIKILTGLSFKAIENFSNYWCLTTFKKFPKLVQVLIRELQKVSETELKLYSYISVLKQANKLGLVEKMWSVSEYNNGNENLVLSCLEHSSANIRMLAFEIICVSHKKSLPSEIEFQQVLKFLQNNVNSDSTVLRLSMLNSLTNFFISLHTSFINYYRNDTNKEAHNLQNFCENLQLFVIESLKLNGNYQRKITTVKIAYLILKHFNEVPRRKQKQTREMNYFLASYLKESGHWLLNSRDYILKLISLLKDPASDVHDSILQLLLEFYLPDISDTMTMNHLIEESLKCIKNKFFFEISCGLNIFRLIIGIIIKNKKVEAKYKNIEDIFNFAYNEITAEHNAKIDVVDSISRGKQLHSFLSLLQIIFETNIKYSYQMDYIPFETMITLLNILKDISNQFAWEEEANISSDFSKMNDMVLSIIKNSSFKENSDDQTKISGLYQIVLNCLWLNVKASCELAAILIQHNKENVTLCEESLNIITHVLETSRHKGAIEAAGAALGQGIRYLTSAQIESEVSKLPLSLLQRKLNELLLETNKTSSVTRRGAGLSIMIHRIVSNDAKKGKPLFHYFMRTILNTCITSQGTCDKHQVDGDEKDLPKAIYIHFLTRIVTDSSLASDMMYYSAELAELAFGNLTNSHWQIRNAALQLYGALIPKLIGQKKPSGTDDDIISSVACDEFRTHSIKMWYSMMKQLKYETYQDIIQGHSNLVPILNTLANIALRYNFSYDLEEQKDSDMNLLPNTLALLGSPIYTVRRLTAKLILNIYSFEIILNAIAKVTITSENHLHGILMVIENCHKVYSHVESHKNQLVSIISVYRKILMNRHISCVCLWSLDKLLTEGNPEVTVDMIKTILVEGKSKQYEPGASLWINEQIKRCLNNMPWTILPDVMSLLLSTYDFEMYCEIIVQKIKRYEMVVPERILLDVSQILLSCNSKTKTSVLWKTLYYISQRIHSNMQIISSSYLQRYSCCEVSYKARYMIPFATRLFAVQGDNENLLIVSRKIFLLCNPESNDIDMRFIAATANNELAFAFTRFSDNIKINAFKSAVILLQDEDEDIRNLSVIFHKRLTGQDKAKHPFICLKEILKEEFMFSKLNEPKESIKIICEDLLNFIDSAGTSKCDELNPFANDFKNIYLEINVLKQLLYNMNKSVE